MKRAVKIPEWKKKEVEHVKKLISDYPIFGLVDMKDLPTFQLQQIRSRLKDSLFLKVAKKRLIRRALSQVKESHKNINPVIDSLQGIMPSLVFSRKNPFKLYSLLDKNKSRAPAKPGQIAPLDIVIPAGPTPFAPGPVISELAAIGVKTKVEDGKLTSINDVTVVKQGEEISAQIADIITKLGIEPMEIGLNLILVYENGLIFRKDVLAVSEEEYMDNIRLAHSDALSLALGLGFITPSTIIPLIKKAFSEARALAESQNIITPDTVSNMIAKADLEVSSLKKAAGIPDVVKKEPEKPGKEVKDKMKEELKEQLPPKKNKQEIKEVPVQKPTEEFKEEIKEQNPPEKKPKEKSVEEPQEKPSKAEEERIEEPKKKPKAEIKYFKEKGPSTEELLKEIYDEGKKSQEDDNKS